MKQDKEEPKMPLHAHSRIRLNIYVPRHIYEAITEIAAEEDWNKTQVVTEALKKYIKQHKTGGIS